MENNAIFIGHGLLTWMKGERVSDRYGTVNLRTDKSWDEIVRLEGHSHFGEKGTLMANVRETRDSPHIGDLFRGLFPSTPEVGDKIVLGEGTLFFEEFDNVGLRPPDWVKRESDWLDPEALYRLHHQTVDLYFIPDKEKDNDKK